MNFGIMYCVGLAVVLFSSVMCSHDGNPRREILVSLAHLVENHNRGRSVTNNNPRSPVTNWNLNSKSRLLQHFFPRQSRRQSMGMKMPFSRAVERISNMFLDSIKPIEQIIGEASGDGTFSSPRNIMVSRGVVRFDGDILMNLPDFIELHHQILLDRLQNMATQRQQTHGWSDVGRVKRAGRSNSSIYWPEGVVPIRIDGKGFTPDKKVEMAKGMNQISSATCICFRTINEYQAKKKVPHVRVVDGSGCSSFVGMILKNQNGTLSQNLIMNKPCRNSRVFSHELIHALGVYHEQSRPDRDDFVDIKLENVDKIRHVNFVLMGNTHVNSHYIPYDYLSLMHYSNKAFSNNGNYTLVPRPDKNKTKYLKRIGRSLKLSKGDADIINKMYDCPTPRPDKPTCQEYPYKFP